MCIVTILLAGTSGQTHDLVAEQGHGERSEAFRTNLGPGPGRGWHQGDVGGLRTASSIRPWSMDLLLNLRGSCGEPRRRRRRPPRARFEQPVRPPGSPWSPGKRHAAPTLDEAMAVRGRPLSGWHYLPPGTV